MFDANFFIDKSTVLLDKIAEEPYVSMKVGLATKFVEYILENMNDLLLDTRFDYFFGSAPYIKSMNS